MMPTAMAVVSDLIEVGRNILLRAAGAWSSEGPRGVPLTAAGAQPIIRPTIRSVDALESRYYMRFSVLDRPGVLGQLTTILGQHDVSIEQVVQEGPRDPDRPVRVVVVTHEAREKDVREALARIDQTEIVRAPTSSIRML